MYEGGIGTAPDLAEAYYFQRRAYIFDKSRAALKARENPINENDFLRLRRKLDQDRLTDAEIKLAQLESRLTQEQLQKVESRIASDDPMK